MIVGIELGKEYAQLSVKTDTMTEPDSITLIAGTEHYRIPIDADLSDKTQLRELFRRLWKMVMPYGSSRALEYLVFCLEENREELMRELLEISGSYEIEKEKIVFLDKKECFCAYMLHQKPELSSQNALLIENNGGEKSKYILRRYQTDKVCVAEVKEIFAWSMEEVFENGAVSSIFLVGDDFEEEWMQENLQFLKKGRRVFAGKNLFVKGAAYRGMDLSKREDSYLYLSKDKVCGNLGLRIEQNGKEEVHTIIYGGKNWWEADVSLDVLLIDEPKLEFVYSPLDGGMEQTKEIALKYLPERPKKTTRLNISLRFLDSCRTVLTVRDLGFGEIFPKSDMFFEGELQWEQ